MKVGAEWRTAQILDRHDEGIKKVALLTSRENADPFRLGSIGRLSKSVIDDESSSCDVGLAAEAAMQGQVALHLRNGERRDKHRHHDSRHGAHGVPRGPVLAAGDGAAVLHLHPVTKLSQERPALPAR